MPCGFMEVEKLDFHAVGNRSIGPPVGQTPDFHLHPGAADCDTRGNDGRALRNRRIGAALFDSLGEL